MDDWHGTISHGWKPIIIILCKSCMKGRGNQHHCYVSCRTVNGNFFGKNLCSSLHRSAHQTILDKMCASMVLDVARGALVG